MNGLLHSLDNFFKDKSENEKWMIIIMLTTIIGYLSYTLFVPYAEEKYDYSLKRRKSLEESINSNRQYINSITVNGDRDHYIKRYDNDILKLETEIKKTNKDINFISVKLEELSPLLFNKESWSIFLNSITAEAKKQEVKIDYIDNKYIDSNGSFGHVLKVGISCKGDYNGIVKFINQLEQNVLVTDVYNIHIYSDTNTSYALSDINISVWGINH